MKLLWRWWWLLLLTPLATASAGYLILRYQTPGYASQVRLLVDLPGSSSAGPVEESLVNTFVEVASSFPVLASAGQQLGLQHSPEDLAPLLTARPIPRTQLFEIVAAGHTPAAAAELATAVAEQLITQNPLNASASLTLVEPARPTAVPLVPYSSNLILLAGLLGLLLAPGLVLLLEYRFLSLRGPRDLASAASGPLLGSIPRLPGLEQWWTIGHDLPAPLADSYESLRINLQLLGSEPAPSSILVTSPGTDEGKTTSALHLALAMARVGTQVVLIDAHLQRPRLHKQFQLDNSVGLTTLLRDEQADARRCIVEVAHGLRMIPSGPALANAAQLFDERLDLLLWVLQQEADVILVDAPPVSQPLTLALARHVQATLLVGEQHFTRRRALRRALQTLQRADGRVLGIVLNRVDQQPQGALPGPKGYLRWLRGEEHRPAPAWRRVLSHIPIGLPIAAGLYLLLYSGGVRANEAYEYQAARGDNALQAAAIELPAPEEAAAFVLPVEQPEPSATPAPTPTATPAAQPDETPTPAALQPPDSLPAAEAPAPAEEQQPAADTPAAEWQSTISRIIIPRIGVDSKVIRVGQQRVPVADGRQVLVWEVAKFAVGHHQQSANPGQGSNIVLAGHVGGDGPVFKDLIMLQPGDEFTLISRGQPYPYQVTEKWLVQETGMSAEVRRENARVMDPTESEVVTLITCWPPRGPNKYAQRIIVRAEPIIRPAPEAEPQISN